MTNSCPVPTSAERQYYAILDNIQEELKQKVALAFDEAVERARSAPETAGLATDAPPRGYFTALVHQQLFCTLCGADPETFEGGKATTAVAVIRNCQRIAQHHWGATINP